MCTISIHFEQITGSVKPMHAVNNGPACMLLGQQSTLDMMMYYDARCSAISDNKDIYVAAAKDTEGNQAILLCHYTDDDTATKAKTVQLDLTGGADSYDVYLLDATTDAVCTGNFTGGSISLAPNTVVLLKSRETNKGENCYE